MERKPNATRGFRHPIHFHETIKSTTRDEISVAKMLTKPRVWLRIIINGAEMLLSDAAFSIDSPHPMRWLIVR